MLNISQTLCFLFSQEIPYSLPDYPGPTTFLPTNPK